MSTTVRAAVVDYPDLGATVHVGELPDGAIDEAETLYSSLFCTLDWFVTHDDAEPTGACVLEHPRHMLLYCLRGDTIEILNKSFAIAPADAQRACRALFRAFPAARRIHLEVMFPPDQLHLPKRVLRAADHMVLALPPSMEEYTASLGKSMRRNLRSSQNRLRRDHPDMSAELVATGARSQELFDLHVAWKRARFEGKGQTSVWDDDPLRGPRFLALLRRRGTAHVTTIAGRPAAILFVFPVGDAVCGHQSAFDPQYAKYSLGIVAQYLFVGDCIARGSTSIDMLWGDKENKAHFGARPVRATGISVFPSQTARLYSMGEARQAARQTVERQKARYWRLRHAARARLDGWRGRPDRRPGPG